MGQLVVDDSVTTYESSIGSVRIDESRMNDEQWTIKIGLSEWKVNVCSMDEERPNVEPSQLEAQFFIDQILSYIPESAHNSVTNLITEFYTQVNEESKSK